MGNRKQGTRETVMNEVERVREELGDEKAMRLNQLREHSMALINMSLCNSKEGRHALSKCLSEVNEILAEAGLVSTR
jgi:hypothetical protein|tara:strand:+ start:604 stop:834 length:231 start_codon:yes stop_codon:yes gene_type:complete